MERAQLYLQLRAKVRVVELTAFTPEAPETICIALAQSPLFTAAAT